MNLGDLNSRSSKLAPEATEAVLVKAGRWSEVEHVMDAIQRKYSAESIKPASGVALPTGRPTAAREGPRRAPRKRLVTDRGTGESVDHRSGEG